MKELFLAVTLVLAAIIGYFIGTTSVAQKERDFAKQQLYHLTTALHELSEATHVFSLSVGPEGKDIQFQVYEPNRGVVGQIILHKDGTGLIGNDHTLMPLHLSDDAAMTSAAIQFATQ